MRYFAINHKTIMDLIKKIEKKLYNINNKHTYIYGNIKLALFKTKPKGVFIDSIVSLACLTKNLKYGL